MADPRGGSATSVAIETALTEEAEEEEGMQVSQKKKRISSCVILSSSFAISPASPRFFHSVSLTRGSVFDRHLRHAACLIATASNCRLQPSLY